MTRFPSEYMGLMLRERDELPNRVAVRLILTPFENGCVMPLATALNDPETVLRTLDDAVSSVYGAVIRHMTEHWRHPWNRLERLEQLAWRVLPVDKQADSGDQRDLRNLLQGSPYGMTRVIW